MNETAKIVEGLALWAEERIARERREREVAPSPPSAFDAADPGAWLPLALSHRWSPDDLAPVLAFLDAHPAHVARLFRWPASVRRDRRVDGPTARTTLPAARVELVERDRIVIRDGYGCAHHFGAALPAWARCALERGWPAGEVAVYARAYRPWETVEVCRASLTFVPPVAGGAPRRVLARADAEPGWTDTQDADPPETFPPATPAHVEPLVYPPALAAVYDAWTREDEARSRGQHEEETRRREAAAAMGADVFADAGLTGAGYVLPPEDVPAFEAPPFDPDSPAFELPPDATTPEPTPTSAPDDDGPEITTDLVAYTDGSGPGTGGDTGVGVVVLERTDADTWRVVAEVSRFTGHGTNNSAELSAIWHALFVAPPGPLTIVTDSAYARGVLLHDDWKIKANGDLVARIRRTLARREQSAPVTIVHVCGHGDCPDRHRPGNWRADYLAGHAVDRERARRGQVVRARKVVDLAADGRIAPAEPTRAPRSRSRAAVQSGDEKSNCAIETGANLAQVPDVIQTEPLAPVTAAAPTAPTTAHPAPSRRSTIAASGSVTGGERPVAPSPAPVLAPAVDADAADDPAFVCVLDTETTGFRAPAPIRDRLVEVAAVRVRVADLDALPPGGDPREVIRGEFARLVHPGCAIPRDASAVHGLYDRDVRDAPPARAVLPELVAFLAGAPVLAHNAAYDAKVLAGEFARAGLPAPGLSVYCSLLAARSLWAKGTTTRDHKLATLAAHFGVPAVPSHRALSDIVATVGVLAGLRRVARERGHDHRLPGLCGWTGGRI